VEATCERVIIITKGKVVATDTVQNLTNRLRGSEAVAVEVEPRDGSTLNPTTVRQRLEQVSGVSRVLQREHPGRKLWFEVESLQGRSVRADLARAVVEANWNLTELRTIGFSLEEVFLQLTSADAGADKAKAEPAAPEKPAEEPAGEKPGEKQ
jgi:ABC-2 type transport system ATP-binding protein